MNCPFTYKFKVDLASFIEHFPLYSTLHIYNYYYYSTGSEISIVCFHILEHTTNMGVLWNMMHCCVCHNLIIKEFLRKWMLFCFFYSLALTDINIRQLQKQFTVKLLYSCFIFTVPIFLIHVLNCISYACNNSVFIMLILELKRISTEMDMVLRE